MRSLSILGLVCLLCVSPGCGGPRQTLGVDRRYEGADYLVAMAASSIRQHDYNKAITLAAAAIDNKDITLRESFLAHGIRANAMLRVGQYSRANQELNALSQLTGSKTDSSHNEANQPYAAALATADTAIAAHPNQSDLYFNRASLFLQASQYDQAVGDSDIALSLALAAMPIHPELRAAWAQFRAGRFKDVVNDVGGDATKASFHPYAILLLHLAKVKLGENDDSLRQAGLSMTPEAWPSPVLAFYLGQTDLKALFAAADRAPNRDIRAGQVCEANFYAGEFEILHGRMMDGIELLKAAQNVCPDDFLEGRAATTELARQAGYNG